MKRNVLLAVIAALALTLGLGSVATAGVGDGAQASAKKGKGKAKGCKKGKGKAKGCKGRDASSGLPLTSGSYDGKNNFDLNVKGKEAALAYAPPLSDGGNPTCIPLPVELEAQTVKSTTTSFQASGSGGNPLFTYKWSITVQPNLSYKLVIDSTLGGQDVDPCDKPGVVITGKLTKES